MLYNSRMLHFSHIHRLLSPKKKMNFVVLLTTIKSFYISYPYSLYNLQYIYIFLQHLFQNDIYSYHTKIVSLFYKFTVKNPSNLRKQQDKASSTTTYILRRQALIITAKSATNTQTQHHEQRTRHKSLCRQPH